MIVLTVAFIPFFVPASANRGWDAEPVSALTAAPLGWGPCPSDPGVECAAAAVPLDYSKPSSERVALEVGRIPATGSTPRGAIFYNPGGPGLSPIRGLASFTARLSPQVRRDYDIVGVDPRGVGGSAALPCGAVASTPPSTLYSVFPTNADQLAEQFGRVDPWLLRTCDFFSSPLFEHMGSIDAAEDIEAVRKLLHIDKIDYFGVSYGAVIGDVYSQLFPAHLRTLTQDSAVDARDWYGGNRGDSLWVRLDSSAYSEDVLTDLFQACESANGACPWASTIRSDYAHAIATLRTGDVSIAGVGTFDMSAFQAEVVAALYRFNLNGADDYETLFSFIHLLAQSSNGSMAEKAVPSEVAISAARVGLGDLPQDPTITKMLTVDAVTCADTREPVRSEQWFRAAAIAEANNPGFGYYWISQDTICNMWPFAENRVTDDLGRRMIDVPFLSLSNVHDPVVGEWDTDRVHSLGAYGSAVVVTDGWGHGVLRSSSCAASVFSEYVVSDVLRPAPVRCGADRPPFTG